MLILLGIGLLLVLPHLVGLLVTRIVRSSWTAWPAAAIAVFGLSFYWWLWVPARNAAEASASETPCGTWQLALGFILLLGLFVHLGVGVLCGLLARRPRGTTRQP